MSEQETLSDKISREMDKVISRLPLSFTDDELNLIRQWFNVVEDLAPEYLEQPDRDLGKRIEEYVRAIQQRQEYTDK